MSDMDRTRVEQLVLKILGPIRANYLDGPMNRDRAYEALNALAIAVAYVLEGCDDSDAEEFFSNALSSQRQDIGR